MFLNEFPTDYFFCDMFELSSEFLLLYLLKNDEGSNLLLDIGCCYLEIRTLLLLLIIESSLASIPCLLSDTFDWISPSF